MPRVELKIYGRVQGVGFRYAARKKAEKLCVICRTARNEPDGSLYIEAESEQSPALEKFIKCHRGPWSAKVERVEIVYL